MNIIIILTYPVYHDFSTPIDLHTEPFREHQIARILSEMDHTTELWYTGHHHEYHAPSKRRQYAIRLFQTSKTGGPTKSHFSQDMVTHAKNSPADLYLLKGVDGGSGIHLLKKHIIPDRKKFGYIIGGHSGSAYMKHASIIFYESRSQQQILISQNRIFRKNPDHQKRLIHLPKSIDTKLFSPRKTFGKRWDILVVGRLISYYKNYNAAGILSEMCQLAVAGGGPDAPRLKKKYPLIHWLGEIHHRDLPNHYRQSRLFFFPGLKDYHPRVIPEAMACGLPVMAFSNRIQTDVIPPDCGLLLNHNDYISPILALLKNKNKISRMGKRARDVAIQDLDKNSCRESLRKMKDILSGPTGSYQA